MSVQEWNEKDANEATAEFMNFARAVKKIIYILLFL
ncbi:hypothetical protein ZPR_3709 [Zunongwangia profunda SM-A87]|uniref:Uncharacterized protein n=1 Tax=Zunongwangia profunda (strain DSM 18752 / CCTCC AB 206139 / SM-A87) TaxID=655815 RepID=D5BL93_ZUNPS|nr:hypothetical protein ZPR_3709 [Zunongwangia profunda SM-A87]